MSIDDLQRRPARIPEMHDLGRQRHGLDRRRRHPAVAHHRPGRGGRDRLQLRPGQRQPSGLRQAGQHQRRRHLPGSAGPCDRDGRQACLPDPHRRHHASVDSPSSSTPAAQLLGATKLQTYTVPGEHDILEDDRKSYLNHYGKGTRGDGWYSFNAHGVHFIGLVNVVNLQGNGLGDLGHDAAGMAGKGREGPVRQHADRGVRACAAVDRLPGLGLGHQGRRRRRCPT